MIDLGSGGIFVYDRQKEWLSNFQKDNPEGGESASRARNKFDTKKTLCIGREKINV